MLVQSVNVVKKIDYSLNSELKKLQFFGAGPKTALPSTLVDDPGWASLFNNSFLLYVAFGSLAVEFIHSAMRTLCYRQDFIPAHNLTKY